MNTTIINSTTTDPMPIEAADMMVILKPKKEWTSAKTFDELAEKMGWWKKGLPFNYAKVFNPEPYGAPFYQSRRGDVVVEVAPGVEPGPTPPHVLDHRAQPAVARHGAGLEQGVPLPAPAEGLVVQLRRADRVHDGAVLAVGAEVQVDAEDEAVVGGVADQRVQALGDEGEVGPRAGLCVEVAAAGGVCKGRGHGRRDKGQEGNNKQQTE